MIPDLESVESLFARMRADGVDVTQPLCWGFYFVAAAREPLERVYAELVDHGYFVTALRPAEDGDDGWRLHVSKTEVLAADKLHRRNIAFNELAAHCDADEYEGWDVDVPSA